MANTKEKTEIVPVTIQVNDIGNLIYTIRDKQVMLDHDLAAFSPSTAAACILGRNENGRRVWLNKDGKTLKELQEAGQI